MSIEPLREDRFNEDSAVPFAPDTFYLTHIEYQIPALDRQGNRTGRFKKETFEKTVYDPRYIPDADFLRFGVEAANDAFNRGALTHSWNGTASNGLRFIDYLDDTGRVRTFFVDF